MQVHDLSVSVIDGVDWYDDPNTPPVRITDIGDLKREGWVSHILRLAVLNGTTYIETAAHLFKDGRPLDDVAPERLVCRAYVVSCQVEGQQILAPDRPLPDLRQGDDAILIHCGWDTHLNSRDYYHGSPYFGPSLQQWLMDHEPSILGGDMLSFDHPEDSSMPFLRGYFAQDGMILCPLQGLGPITGKTVTLCAAPLKLAGANCAPCRVLAWECG